MSANRAVQAAQRRRAAPADVKGPQTSINSAQNFNKTNQPQPAGGIGSINKMTIPQAITLITLRLGALESKMQGEIFGGASGEVDPRIMETILSRLDALENQQQSQSQPQIPKYSTDFKQIETMKHAILQMKNVYSKEIASLKANYDTLHSEITEMKESLELLQNLTMEKTQNMLLDDFTDDVHENNQENEIILKRIKNMTIDYPSVVDEVVDEVVTEEEILDLKTAIQQSFQI
jgi:hypothetical protein